MSRDASCPGLRVFEEPLAELDADFEVLDGKEGDWRDVALRLDDGRSRSGPFATIRREHDAPKVAPTLRRYVQGLGLVEPRNAADYLCSWLRNAKVLYGFSVREDASDAAWQALRAVLKSLQLGTGGFVYTAGEGWSNDDGFLVTWEVDGDNEDEWDCAVLAADAQRWLGFRMDAVIPAHLLAFRAGVLPDGIRARSIWPV